MSTRPHPPVRHHARRAITAATLVALCSLGAPRLHAQDKDAQASAELLDVEAQAFYDARNYPAALTRWKQVYEVYPNPATLWNIARSYEELGTYLQARGAFTLYLKFKSLSRQDIGDARGRISAINARLDQWRRADEAGRQRLAAGDPKAAEDRFVEAIGIYAAATTIWELGALLEEQGRIAEAVEVFERYSLLPELEQSDQQRVSTRLATLRAKRTDTRADANPTHDDGAARVLTDPHGVTTPEDGAVAPPAGGEASSGGGASGLQTAGWVMLGVAVVSYGTAGLLRWSVGDGVDHLTVLSAGQRPEESDDAFARRVDAYTSLRDDVQLDLALMWTGLGVGLVSTVAGITLLAIGGGEAERPGEGGATVRVGVGRVEFETSF